MLRPRESRDLRLISSNITVTPTATLTRAHDVFGNAVMTATFQTMSDRLIFDAGPNSNWTVSGILLPPCHAWLEPQDANRLGQIGSHI